MTVRQNIELRRSEIRQRLGAIAEIDGDGRTDVIASEQNLLMVELRESEPRLQAAIAAEESDTRLKNPGDGEGAEHRAIRSRVNVSDYMGAALEQRAVDGAALEYNQVLHIPGNRFPLEMLAPAIEHRAETNVDAAATQRTWLDRLFAETMSAYIGVSFEAVPPGLASFPVTATGPSGAQRARMEAAGAGAWTLSVSELKPKRNTVHLVFSSEDAARLPGLEDALGRDMRMSIQEAVDRAVFNADTGADGTDADIAGLKTLAGTEKTLTQANKIKADETFKAFLELVDGRHASTIGELRVVSSVGSNVLWGGTIHNSAASNETIAQFLARSGVSWRTRDGIDANTANGDFGAYIGRQRGIQGAGVAAVWNSGELIRDPYTSAAKGEVNLTLAYLWDFAVPRASNFARLKYVT